jgi:exodeoxyribonuclease V alpha subunit
MTPELVLLERHGVFSPLDVELADTLMKLSGESSPLVALAVAAASAAVSRGHTCAELSRLAGSLVFDDEGKPLSVSPFPTLDVWLAALRASSLVSLGKPAETSPRPLVLDGKARLYLKRYFDYEERLALAIKERLFADPERVDGPLLREGLDRLFGKDSGGDLQRRAALVAISKRLSLISGGPGTGKTHTVAKVLVLLEEQARALGAPSPRVALLAPTGKAAQRLRESIADNLGRIECAEEVRSAIETEASTIHRALGVVLRAPTRFRHDQRDPLPKDVVIVDEASMVDLALMTKLFSAVAPRARLILLGDKDQLASVEAGAILGDIHGGRGDDGYSRAFSKRVKDLTKDKLPLSRERPTPGLHDSMVHLVKSHRFAPEGGIASLARAVNAGDADAALAACASFAEIELHELEPSRDPLSLIGALALEKYGPIGEAEPSEKLELLEGFRFLCCHRRGPFGVETVNRFVLAHLRKHGRVEPSGEAYDGAPVLVSSNDYQVELFNGDIGVLGRSPKDASGVAPAGNISLEAGLVAFFPTEQRGVLRTVPIGRLPLHEPAFAMSVHKSQGSEFEEIALLLPERVSPLVTRELVYTAVTRARTRVRIFGTKAVLAEAVKARVQRASGLRERLWDVPQLGFGF